MQRPIWYIAILFLTGTSCKTTADNVVGTYEKEGTTTRLLIKKDKTFEFIGPENASTEYSLKPAANQNIFTAGSWDLSNHQLLLNSSMADSLEYESETTDSITRFTTITSFNFWNRYGEPVRIRSIRFPSSKPKPHFGNSIYLFSQDFKATDTLVFYLEGYPDFSYPGTIPYALGNNTHKIILREHYRPAVFKQNAFRCKKNKMFGAENNLSFSKKK